MQFGFYETTRKDIIFDKSIVVWKNRYKYYLYQQKVVNLMPTLIMKCMMKTRTKSNIYQLNDIIIHCAAIFFAVSRIQKIMLSKYISIGYNFEIEDTYRIISVVYFTQWFIILYVVRLTRKLQ